ncbi:hypothetical protein [Methanobacterium ferruginis]|uniref:hypothetical protein n=1 Tax=Methanobacterium ferruginis TaxID=710191 RepID=UPI002573735D|nr:hypothetical protein [Methanobacterium ferruginis]BDZ68003.1 hypothetical protein GCM10025860_14510 [Methanobacterium ferruginis]
MKKSILLMLIIFMMVIASSGCTNSDNNQTTTTELNRTDSGSGSGSGSTESGGSSEGGSGSSSDGTYFDSGKVSLENGETYEWKSYQINENKIVIYSIYTKKDGSTVKQTNTLEKSSESPETVNMITVVPKSTGTSSWQHITGNQGYTNLLDYYWKHFRPNWLMEGPIH